MEEESLTTYPEQVITKKVNLEVEIDATATDTGIFERITASQAGTIFDTEVSSASDVGASYWDGSSWS